MIMVFPVHTHLLYAIFRQRRKSTHLKQNKPDFINIYIYVTLIGHIGNHCTKYEACLPKHIRVVLRTVRHILGLFNLDPLFQGHSNDM